METTNKALILFLKSLPPSSTFEILPFGSSFKAMSGSEQGYNYNDKTLNQVISIVERFEADLGGTEIFKPLEYAIKNIKTTLSKRIFMLTDGEVSNRE